MSKVGRLANQEETHLNRFQKGAVTATQRNCMGRSRHQLSDRVPVLPGRLKCTHRRYLIGIDAGHPLHSSVSYLPNRTQRYIDCHFLDEARNAAYSHTVLYSVGTHSDCISPLK